MADTHRPAEPTVRYDTAGGRLAAVGARLERSNGVWRVQLPTERGTARLVEYPAGPEGWMPETIADIVGALAGCEPVMPEPAERPAFAAARHPTAPTPNGIVGHALARSYERLIRNDGLVRLGGDEEAVHQARVAVRTLRNDLRTFAPLLDEPPARALRGDLQPLADALGAVRDTDVLAARLQRRVSALAADDAAAAAALLDRLALEHVQARNALLDLMRSPRYSALLDRVATASSALVAVGDPSRRRLLALARAPWMRLVRDVTALPTVPSDAELHAVRLRVKRARYAVDAVAPIVGKAARRGARRLAALQDALGEHQDATVFAAWLRRAATAAGQPSEAFVAGLLAAEEQTAAATAREMWKPVWQSVVRASRAMW